MLDDLFEPFEHIRSSTSKPDVRSRLASVPGDNGRARSGLGD